MGVISDGNPYGIEAGLCYSFPIRCKGCWEYDIVTGYTIDQFSHDKMKATEKELKEEKIDLTLPKLCKKIK